MNGTVIKHQGRRKILTLRRRRRFQMHRSRSLHALLNIAPNRTAEFPKQSVCNFEQPLINGEHTKI